MTLAEVYDPTWVLMPLRGIFVELKGSVDDVISGRQKQALLKSLPDPQRAPLKDALVCGEDATAPVHYDKLVGQVTSFLTLQLRDEFSGRAAPNRTTDSEHVNSATRPGPRGLRWNTDRGLKHLV